MRCVMISNLEDDRSPWDVPSNECRAWAYALEADTRSAERVREEPQLVADYDLAIVELTTNLLSLPGHLKRWFPGLTVVGLAEGWAGAISSADEASQCRFVEACRGLDMLGVLVERAVPYYQLYTGTPAKAQWLGVPFPKRWTDTLAPVPPEAKANDLLLPFGVRPVRSGLAHLLAVAQLRERHPGLRVLVPRSSTRDEEYLTRLGVEVELVAPRDWPSFFEWLRHVYAVLDLDHLPTWGRLAADCAAAGVPYVGSNATHCGRALGVLTCDPFDAATALGYVDQLLGNAAEAVYRHVVAEQYRRLEVLAEEASVRRFWACLERAMSCSGRPSPV